MASVCFIFISMIAGKPIYVGSCRIAGFSHIYWLFVSLLARCRLPRRPSEGEVGLSGQDKCEALEDSQPPSELPAAVRSVCAGPTRAAARFPLPTRSASRA